MLFPIYSQPDLADENECGRIIPGKKLMEGFCRRVTLKKL
jgi:hypothetical protein